MKKNLIFFLLIFLLSACGKAPLPVNNNQLPENLNQPLITNFEQCAAAGNPIMESYPRQCRANDQTFVEILKTVGDSCQQNSDCTLPFDYAILSHCPYQAFCYNQICQVGCPMWGQATNTWEVKCQADKDCDCSGYTARQDFSCKCINSQCVALINENKTPATPACKDQCGNGKCEEMVCLAIGCPCSETATSCPQDCQKDSTAQTGIISGKVTIGPICPVERIDQPCEVPAAAYTSRQVIVYDQTKTKIIQTQYFNPNGTFAFSLPVGTYVLDLAKSGLDRSSELPQTVTVKANETVRLDFSIDTGIR